MYISDNAADNLFGFENPLTQSEDKVTKINGDNQYDKKKETSLSFRDRESITDHTEL